VIGDEAVDGGLEVNDALEDATLESALGRGAQDQVVAMNVQKFDALSASGFIRAHDLHKLRGDR
jgi:hypothetical protein